MRDAGVGGRRGKVEGADATASGARERGRLARLRHHNETCDSYMPCSPPVALCVRWGGDHCKSELSERCVCGLLARVHTHLGRVQIVQEVLGGRKVEADAETGGAVWRRDSAGADARRRQDHGAEQDIAPLHHSCAGSYDDGTPEPAEPLWRWCGWVWEVGGWLWWWQARGCIRWQQLSVKIAFIAKQGRRAGRGFCWVPSAVLPPPPRLARSAARG